MAHRALVLDESSGSVIDTPTGEQWGIFENANPLGDRSWRAKRGWPKRTVVWSGTPADELFAIDPRTWGPAALAQFNALCDELTPALEAVGAHVLFRTHARHVLCDAQRCLNFARAREGGPLGFVLDPALLMEPSMMEKAGDHLRRMVGALGPFASAVLVSDVEGAGEDEVRPAPAGAGVWGAELLGEVVREGVPESTPLITAGDGADEQLAALGLDR